LVSACDGNIDSAERDAIARAATLLDASGAALEPSNLLDRCAKLAEGEPIKTELDRVGTELRAAEMAGEGVKVAAVIALVSQGMSLGEFAALRRLAEAAALPEEALAALIADADRALNAT
jgi:hypothetical protein